MIETLTSCCLDTHSLDERMSEAHSYKRIGARFIAFQEAHILPLASLSAAALVFRQRIFLVWVLECVRSHDRLKQHLLLTP